MKTIYILSIAFMGLCISCKSNKKEEMNNYEKGTFGYDVAFLKEKDKVRLLTDKAGRSQVLVSPGYQGKVFTSTASGLEGKSLGYIKYEVFDAAQPDEHMNGYGGENRLWLGPEGGQYSIYFAPGVEQIYDNWHTPSPIDTEAWEVLAGDQQQVNMMKSMELLNYRGTRLKTDILRRIQLVEPSEIGRTLGVEIGATIESVGYQTENKLYNRNDFEWTPETGTLCIWMLDMYHPAPSAVTIIPFNSGDDTQLGKIATTDYFGEIPGYRLKINDGVLFLRTDGKMRNKLGMNALRTKGIAANYNADEKLLTITTYSVVADGVYLNQEWNPERNPLIGDAMNAYNDGPLEDGSIMGPFLELESASPAAFLKPGEQLTHRHDVYHFTGDESDLSLITEKLLGVSITQIKHAFKE
ncbi:hypothetical protein LJC35_03025 [Parabacteroides sp. OttesenSCG-928-N08]|nr:hypothetical protein [Parabacteroides sp. OttesenSCG-928-N08]